MAGATPYPVPDTLGDGSANRASASAFAGFEALLRAAATRPAVMGILNVTPDSFSDGGRYPDVGAAVAAGEAMIAEGAAVLDVGGESTRPGAAPVSTEQELDRVVPVVGVLAARGHLVSVDTRNAAVMAAALHAGAAIVNDVSGLTHDPQAMAVCAAARCGVVLMHMRGTPETMATLTRYADVVSEVAAALEALRARALKAGISESAILLDPGIGFAKDFDQNIALLRALGSLPGPLLLGVSRKKFVGELSGVAKPGGRDAGSLATALFAASQGAAVLRVHDVAGTVQGVRVWSGLHRAMAGSPA